MVTRGRADQGGTLPLLLPREEPLLMLIDGHAQVHRAWHAISVRQHLSVSKTGEDVTAVFGFTNAFLKAIQEWSPTHCAIAFDLPVPTFRHKMFPDYKAQRPPSPPELRTQLGRIKQLMRAFNVPIFEMEGYEADDVIGTLCRKAEEQQIETLILTGDTDTFQLVSPWVRVALQRGIQDREVYDEAGIRARYGGLSPEQQPDLKALKGDSSDNIPGVPGVGDKTAVKLMVEYGSLDGIYESIDSVQPPKLQESLRSNRERVLLGRELTTIVRDVPLELDLDQSRFWRYDRRELVDLFRELEFNMASRLPEPRETSSQAAEPGPASHARQKVDSGDYKLVDTQEGLDELLGELRSAGSFSFDTETTGTDPMNTELVGLSFSTAPGRAWYVPVAHKEGSQLPMDKVLSDLKPVLASPEISKTAHNANYDVTVLSNYGLVVTNLDFDTMVAARLLGEKGLSLKNLGLQVLDVEMQQITDLIGTGRKQVTFDKVPLENAMSYACTDADVTGRLRSVQEAELREQGMWDLFSKMEMALVPVLVSMQRNGIMLDAGSLQEMSLDLNAQLGLVTQQIFGSVGHEVNIDSPQQLSSLLFNELGLPKTKRTRTGSYSTDANALESLKGHPVVDGILEYRQLSKLKSTYVDALPELVNPRTGRLHTSYNQTGSATGRMSSSEPNLQNIPVRTELGRVVRKAFVAENAPDWLLFSADYSQIELRVLAELSRDPGLLEAFNRGEDIHSATAALMYDVPMDQVTWDMRRIAKVLNFGVIYGLSPYGISQQTEFSPDEGQKFIDNYFTKYPGIKEYIESVKQKARNIGYVATPLGRRRYIPDIVASNYNVRQAAERAAVNMPIQGGAADIMKLAMIRVHRSLEESDLQSRMLLQVHDELMFEVPARELDALQEIVYRDMPNALEMSVPLKVDVKKGYNWGEME